MTIDAIRRHPALSRLLLRHFAEMLAAMLVGMLALGPLWPIPAALAARADVASFVMATDMSVAMTIWMWHRGHGRAAIGEMTAVMYAPFVALLIPWYAGFMSSEAVLLGGHLLTVPAMAAVMVRRVHVYAAPHVDAVPRTGLLTRWPTALALLMTVDNIVEPRPLPPLSLLVLAFSYPIIGVFRRTLRSARVLGTQLAATGTYLLLIGAALLARGDLSLYLVGAGWLGHAGWDWWHHRHNAVVPRPFAEWCGVIDAIIGASVIVYAMLAA